ncbi:restriction endonuclease subunit S [Enterococcus hirae]|nr:restriction endonuclease subunit S [Enterococcus hirae]
MSNDTQPEIRFPGFTEDWEERKLSNMTQYKNGKGNEDRQVESGKLELVNLNSISIDGGLKYSGKFVDEADETLMKDDLVMILSDVGHGDLLGRVALIPEDNRFVLNQRVALLRTNETANPKFLFSYINAHQYYFKSQGAGMSQLNISKGSVENFTGFVPSLSEQKQIGNFFKQLDDTIALQQRKLDLLKETKKGFLQKMFPKNGAKVPEIRFPGFTGDWEQRKLGDVLTVSKEKNKSNSYSKEQILSVSREVGTVNQIEYQGRSFAGADISGYKIVYPGQLIYTKSPLKGAPYGIFQLVTEEGIVSPLYAVYNSTEQALASFIGLQLKSDNIATHYLSPLVSKGAKNTINITDEGALDGRVTYPTITEQQKIVAFFKQLENTITLHQRKLDLLKETKKGFLQKMFV